MPPVTVTVALPFDCPVQGDMVLLIPAIGVSVVPMIAVVAEVQPLLLVTVTVKVPAVRLVAVAVVCPLLQR